ncbi:MAG TPA: hypothetical protein VG371_12555 [Solirubrobacteraceae bacterium]|nr:hypothetical protein [Solirubrobacteraceae bacterium]
MLAPGSQRASYRLLERLGEASYQIFLVQIVWFGVVADRSVPVGIAGIIATSLLGLGYFSLQSARRSPGLSGGPGRRVPAGV